MAKILLTGASSFTGLWIAFALSEAGHTVIATMRRNAKDYSGLRRERVERLRTVADLVFAAPFESERFVALAADGFDLLAHHAADIPNYRDATYDVLDGVRRNIVGADAALEAFARAGGRAIIATGTVFETGEGGRLGGELSVTPYGLSKGMTNDYFRHQTRWRGLAFGKFVIAAPFGPFEEGRFAWSIMRDWFSGRAGEVRTPRYVRDNIPAPLLATAYAALVDRVLSAEGDVDVVSRPSGFVGPQEQFARILSAEMAPRLGFRCEVRPLPQPHLLEPEVRINSDAMLEAPWDSEFFWDQYADYYKRLAASGVLAERR
jgi:nucleoside-diphosphate-sugar epimerase